mmetsp:Transcript_9813/g.30282  ORF Transcript_9813/g.30282 Transcript_9813/m.30282 type:complete len:241 (+) Transcript_9813:598-1320(+)
MSARRPPSHRHMVELQVNNRCPRLHPSPHSMFFSAASSCALHRVTAWRPFGGNGHVLRRIAHDASPSKFVFILLAVFTEKFPLSAIAQRTGSDAALSDLSLPSRHEPVRGRRLCSSVTSIFLFAHLKKNEGILLKCHSLEKAVGESDTGRLSTTSLSVPIFSSFCRIAHGACTKCDTSFCFLCPTHKDKIQCTPSSSPSHSAMIGALLSAGGAVLPDCDSQSRIMISTYTPGDDHWIRWN